MRITIEIDTANAAFTDDIENELRYTFSQCAAIVFDSESFGEGINAESTLMDSNGNSCGSVRLIYDDPAREARKLQTPARIDTSELERSIENLERAGKGLLGSLDLFKGEASANPARACECGALLIRCADCGAERFSCASTCQDCGSTDMDRGKE